MSKAFLLIRAIFGRGGLWCNISDGAFCKILEFVDSVTDSKKKQTRGDRREAITRTKAAEKGSATTVTH